MPEYKMLIPPDRVESTRMWFREREGCLVWHDQEIKGWIRPDVMTPKTNDDGSPVRPPHWSMGNPEPILPEQIGVRAEQIITPPLDWWPVCGYCQGTGRYSVAAVAEARKWPIEQVRKSLVEDQKTPVRESDDTIGCSGCQETGHTNRQITGGSKPGTKGAEPGDKLKKRAHEAAAKLGADVLCDYIRYDERLWEVVFYTERIAPFSLEG